jgi:hypothetical protein
VKARNTSVALIFTFLACTDWLEVLLMSWCLFVPDNCWSFYCDDCCKCCWSELQRAAPNYRLGIVYLKMNVVRADPGVVACRFLLHCKSYIAWLQPLQLARCGNSPFLQVAIAAGWGTLLSSVSLGLMLGKSTPCTTGSREAACSAPRCGQNTDNCSNV